jgi:hypothetical protein
VGVGAGVENPTPNQLVPAFRMEVSEKPYNEGVTRWSPFSIRRANISIGAGCGSELSRDSLQIDHHIRQTWELASLASDFLPRKLTM